MREIHTTTSMLVHHILQSFSSILDICAETTRSLSGACKVSLTRRFTCSGGRPSCAGSGRTMR